MERKPASNSIRHLDRRQIVAGAAGATLVPFTIGVAVAAQDSEDATQDVTTATATATSCVLAAELTEGPYYLDNQLVRQDITDGKSGVPLDLTMTVIDATSCEPLENAAVEIWHCDANGFYSGFVEHNPDGRTSNSGYADDGSDADSFLRGVQLTDPMGVVTFGTIYPGWYTGRDIHIHLKVHVGGAAEDGTYDGGTVAHTGQIGFADDMTDLVAAIEPYASRVTTFTRLEEDGIFAGHADDAAFFVELAQVDPDDLAAGLTGSITLGVDPAAVNDNSGGGGGGGGGQ